MIDKKLFFVLLFLVIFLYFFREIEFRQIYEKKGPDEVTSIMRIETFSNYSDNIVPILAKNFLKVKVTNLGPAESPLFLLKVRLCKPPQCEPETVNSPEDVPLFDTLPIQTMSRGQSAIKYVYGFKVVKEGSYGIFYTF